MTQPDLFANEQKPVAKQQASYGKTLKRAFVRERTYQTMKRQSDELQKSWKNLQPRFVSERVADRRKNEELESSAPITVVLVACVSLKRKSAQRAKDLYVSDWFKKARRFAEANGDSWFVLSARHGLVEPEELIEPYNYTLNGKRKADRQSWAQRTATVLRKRIPPKSRIIILAGLNYREHLIPLLDDRYFITTPLIELGIGEQLAFLKAANK